MKKNAQESGEKTEPEEVNEDDTPKTAPSRGMSMLDFIMRIVAAISILGSAIAMGTSGQTLNFFRDFVRFKGQFQDLPTFRFFVVSNAIAAVYLVLSLVLSAFHILKTSAKVTRSVLIILDMTILALLTAGASAAAAIAYLANKGNDQVNWSAICHQYNSFCERVSGSLVGSFLGALLLMLFSWILPRSSSAYAVDIAVCYCPVSTITMTMIIHWHTRELWSKYLLFFVSA